MLRIVEKATLVTDRTAIVSGSRSFSYADLLRASGQFADVLLDQEIDLREAHVAFMVESGFEYVKVQWGMGSTRSHSLRIAAASCAWHYQCSILRLVEWGPV